MPEVLPDTERRRISGLISGETIVHPDDADAALTYDTVLIGTGRLGAAELEAATPAFLACVRWAFFVEKGYERVKKLQEFLAAPPPGETPAMRKQRELQEHGNIRSERERARKELELMRRILLLDPDPDEPTDD